MEDIKCCHQMLINMKEQYRKGVEAFVKVIKQNLNYMHLVSIWKHFELRKWKWSL